MATAPSILTCYVEAAEIHAREQHAQQGALQLSDVDRILDRERQANRADQLAAVQLCYGFWFGAYLAQRLPAAKWVGLHEPIPPRLVLDGQFYSPVDAVGRRVRSDKFPMLAELFAEVQRTHVEHPADAEPQNLAAWERLADSANFVVQDFPQSREQAEQALDPWLLSEGVAGKQVLCLAAGGGTHAPLLAMADAHVTVVDFSARMLEFDRSFAMQSGRSLEIMQLSLHNLRSLREAAFDIVIQPVSMNYVSQPRGVYCEVARILKPGGLYVVQNKQPVALQIVASGSTPGTTQPGHYVLTSQQGLGLPVCSDSTPADPMRERETIEYPHSLETLLGELCRAGFVIEDFCEPCRGDAWALPGTLPHRALFIPPYLRIKARRERG